MTGKKRLRRITAFILALILILQGTGQYTIADGTQGRSIVPNDVYAAEGDSGQTQTSYKLQNGSFEEGQTWTGSYNQPDQNAVPSWNTTAFQGKIELFRKNSNTYINGVTLAPTDGTFAAELNADEESTLYQNVATTPSSIYQWGLDHGARNGTDTMALVIGPSQAFNPSKPSKEGRDQLMQMVDWLIEQGKTAVKDKDNTGLGEQLTVYSKKFGENGTFQNNEGNDAFSLTPSSIYTEEWHIWIIADSKATSGDNPWGKYGSNAEGSAGSTDEAGNAELDTSKYYLYTVPSSQTKTLFGFVSVGCVDLATSADKAKTYGNFLDNINFEIFHPLSGSTTLHGSGVVGGSDGTVGGEGSSGSGHEVTVDKSLITYAVDGEPLKVQAVIKAGDASAGCEFVGLYYTKQKTDGSLETKFLQKAGNEIDDTGSLTDEQKKDKWIKSTNTAGDTIYTYYLDNITTATDLHFIFIKSPTVTYDPNGGKAYEIDRDAYPYNLDEAANVYSFKPVQTGSDENSVTYTFIPPYVSHAPEGQNDGWKFMGWLLTGDKAVIPDGISPINPDGLGTLLLQAEHTIACDYTVGSSNKEQYFKIWNGSISTSYTSTATEVKWKSGDTPAYANVHKGLTMVAQWRWRQAFIPQLKNGNTYDNSADGGTVEITSVTDKTASNTNYNGTYNDKGGKSYHAETDEVITVKATSNTGFVFEGWYDAAGNLLTTKDTYTYTETKESVNTFYARFSETVTQTFIRQIQGESGWTDITDESIATLGCYTYTDAVGTTASSTAIPAAGYRLVGWVDSTGASVNTNLLKNNGSTITYITTGDATYYARFEPIPTVSIKITKKWDDNNYSGRPSKITVTLYADYDGAGSGQKVKVNTTIDWDDWDKSNADEWTATITGLPGYTATGTSLTQIVYSLEEEDIDHYIEKVVSSAPSGESGEWQFTITNTLELQVNLKKLDKDDGTPIAGTKFMLYKAVYDTASGNYIRKNDDAGIPYTTDSQGCISIPIQQTGAYELVETEAATGYELGTTPFDCFFSVKDSDLRQKLDITSKTAAPKGSLTSDNANPSFILQSGDGKLLTETGLTNVRKTGTLTINKKDGTTGTALDGVKFTLYRQNGEGSYDNGWEFTTGKKYKAFDEVKEVTAGVTTIENLPWGNYKLVETTTLDGYILNTAEYLFTVSKDNVSSPIKLTDISNNVITDNDITNDKNKIQFIKQPDDAGSVNLTGGIYRIVKVSGNSREEVSFYTDAAGADGLKNTLTAGDTVYGLAAGSYEIKEITAPYGYKLNSTPVAFVMDEYGIATRADNNTVWSDNKIIMQDEPVQIALKKIDGDTNLTVTGAKFKLTGIFANNGVRDENESSIENLTVDNFTEQLKGKLIASTGSQEGVDCFTYHLEETEAPEGYVPLTETIQFRLTETGKIELVQPSTMVAVDNEATVPEIIVKNSPEKCSFEVTKVFAEDGTWKNTIRPSQVSIQLYSQIEGTAEKVEVESPVVLDITTDKDSYSYTYDNLPAYHYDNVDGVSVPKKILYSVEEKAVLPSEKAAYYRTDYSTVTESESENSYSQTITNTAAELLPAGVLNISKVNIGGEMEDTFQIKVTLIQDGKETVFKDTYEVYKADDDNDASNDELLRTVSASEGYVELKGGEYAKLVLPKDVSYHIEEVLKTYGSRTLYTPSYSAQNGTVRENDTVEALIVNKANIYTAIENGTENLGISYQGGNNPKNAGGTVGVVAGDGSNKEAYDKVGYEEGKLSVYWMPMTDWCFTDSFTVIYNEHNGSGEGGEEKYITVSDFLDEDGSPKDASDECYSALLARYPDMGIEQNDAGAIILKLANTGEGMPYLNKVLVSFMPTVAVINTTKDNAGGQVKAEKGQYSNIADGKGVHGENRYPVTTVYAKADEGYSIDLLKLTIGNVGTIAATEYQTAPSLLFTPARLTTDKKVLSLTSGNSFSISLPYSMAGTADDYSIQGRVEILATNDGKPVEIAIILNGLSIPVDIGVEFVRSETPDEPGEDDGISFVITKKFIQDDIWKNTIRPSQVSLQLYSKIEGAEEVKVGNPVVLDINTNEDSYSYTYHNLPVYYFDNVNGVLVPKKISYFVKEAENQPDVRNAYYSAVYSAVSEDENAYLQTITNTAADLLPAGTLKISKTNIGGAMEAMFRIKVTISRDGKETVFKDTYEVYKSDDDSNDSNDVLLRTTTASEGYVELKGGEYAKLVLPKDVNYHIEEILDSIGGTVQYIPAYTGQDGIIIENSLVEASIINRANIYTAIANDTENEGSSYQEDEKPKNAGGTVGVVTGGSSDEVAYDKVDYQEGKMSVYWMPMTDWCLTDSFTVTYREYDGSVEGGVEKSITVSGFLDENGIPKPVSDECYDELRARYTDMEIGQNDDGAIILRLADTVEGMPYLSKVDVAFTPTVAIINTTEKNAGGQVKAENGQYSDIADGKGVQGEKRYPDTKVYAKADKDYYIDLSHITIGNVDTIALGRQTAYYASPFFAFAAPTTHISMLTSSEELVLDDANSFEVSLPYLMAGRTDNYSVHGRVEVLDSQDGKPTEIAIILEGLSIPVDVGIMFDKTPASEDQSEEESSEEESSEEESSEEESSEEESSNEESSTETSTEQTTEGEGIYEAPSTGSTSNKWYYAFLVLICGLGTVIFTKKRSPKKADK